jgi:uncharacterized integral membrane protein
MNKLEIKKIIHEDYVLLLKIFKTKNVQAVHVNQPLVFYSMPIIIQAVILKVLSLYHL